VIIDIGLAGDLDGLGLTRIVRTTTNAGIIIVSGRGEPLDRVIGLEVGADDYIAKPFEPRELLARVRSLLRRTRAERSGEPLQPGQADASSLGNDIYSFGDWTLSAAERTVVHENGQSAELTSGEFELLKAFVEHPNRVLSRGYLMDLVYGSATPAFDRSIDVRIRRLRQKIEDAPDDPRYIKTVRNAGYVFSTKVSRRPSGKAPA